MISTAKPESGYALLDSGDNEKLERFGSIVVVRPDPQALWPKRLFSSEWKKAQAVFRSQSGVSGSWQEKDNLPKKWMIQYGGLRFLIRLSSFKHVGIFPENAPSWEWMRQKISGAKRPITVLNLFGYTGGATLACAMSGASVCHLDGSKVAVNWARENAEASGLTDRPIRWIVDDARSFVQRELKRGRKYDAILLDPPAFGHGPAGELWRIERDLLPLLENCKKLLSPQPLFFLINGYAAGYSSLAYANNFRHLFGDKGQLETGELAIAHAGDERLLPCGIFARWSA